MAAEKEVKQEIEPKKGKSAKKSGGKKSKLFVLVALLAVLGGGGYFGLKMAGGKHPTAPELKLGDESHVVSLGEFMVNTSDGASFLKATVLVHLADGEALFPKGGEHGGGTEGMAPYIDAVRKVLSSQTLADLKSAEGSDLIKHRIADAVNVLYHKTHAKEDRLKPKAVIGKGTNTETWQSTEGPVLVVYFTEFVWE